MSKSSKEKAQYSIKPFILTVFLPKAQKTLICGADGVFFEVHPDPKTALSDGSNMVRLADFPAILEDLKNLFTFLHQN